MRVNDSQFNGNSGFAGKLSRDDHFKVPDRLRGRAFLHPLSYSRGQSAFYTLSVHGQGYQLVFADGGSLLYYDGCFNGERRDLAEAH